MLGQASWAKLGARAKAIGAKARARARLGARLHWILTDMHVCTSMRRNSALIT